MTPSEHLINIIKDYIKLTREDRQLVVSLLKPMTLKKGDHLLKIGDRNILMTFMESGLMRSYYINEEGNEVTSGFFQPLRFCTDLNSFQNGGKSERSIEALIDCSLLVLTSANLQMLRNQIKDWSYFEQHYIATLLLQKVNFHRKIADSNAAEAYQSFLEFYPHAARYAPRYHIASFLGMSPYTLSRIK